MAQTINISEDTEAKYAGRLNAIYTSDEMAKKRFERQLYINVNFMEGYHFLSWRASNRTIDRITKSRGMRIRSIPKAGKQGETITSMMTSNPVVPVVSPLPGEGRDEAQAVSDWLQQLTYDLKLKILFAEWVYTAFHQTYAVLEVGYDGKEDEIYVDLWDAFDILLPPGITSLKETPYLIKLVPKRISELVGSEIYNSGDNPYRKNLKNLVADPRWAGSEMKNLSRTERFGRPPGGEEQTDIVILKEFYLKEKIKERERVRIVTIASEKIIRSELTEYEKFPFVLLKLKEGHIYKPAWIQSFMPSNKSLDMIVSHLENFARLFWIGKIFKRRGERVDRLTNEPGAVYEYSGPQPPELKDMPNVPPALFTFITFLERWIEEQGVTTRPVSTMPSSVRSARMMESMKRVDYGNLGTPMLFYSAALERLYEKIIDCAALNYTDIRGISVKAGEKEKSFTLIGEGMETYGEEGEEKPFVIKKDYKVKIDLEPAFAYTSEGRRMTLTELIKLGIPLQEVLLREMKVSNISDLLREMEMKKKTSLIDAPDFSILPNELKRAVLQYLQTPEGRGRNPLSYADMEVGGIGQKGQ